MVSDHLLCTTITNMESSGLRCSLKAALGVSTFLIAKVHSTSPYPVLTSNIDLLISSKSCTFMLVSALLRAVFAVSSCEWWSSISSGMKNRLIMKTEVSSAYLRWGFSCTHTNLSPSLPQQALAVGDINLYVYAACHATKCYVSDMGLSEVFC